MKKLSVGGFELLKLFRIYLWSILHAWHHITSMTRSYNQSVDGLWLQDAHLLSSLVKLPIAWFSSVQFSGSVVSNSLRPQESQHARLLCPSSTPGVHSVSHPSSPWCHPAISSSVVPFSSCPQSLPASESFPMSQHFTSGGQSTGVSALVSFLPKNTQVGIVNNNPLLYYNSHFTREPKGFCKLPKVT